ncbi:nicotinate-nucleotide--dimethylbenzimidazole phosphoribosyltransferase [Streptomyces sp. NRRL S-920]|uniref:nicotinate-nucleotide--dimethylbenzimidazole phosphoribosyltransferase n=1 Tax=Streptomyces sp. NRRL S-920 TaxID=1463921 RepID=UPI0004C63642|nr:nicotinate-nucleotide--dimethylbenzimidazole phosphoribosyltransferase [Streptomyces sp. NRRL S-920]
MTDTGQVPGEGLPEGAGNGVPSGPVQGMGAQQPGAPAPDAYTFADPADSSENPADEDDLLLMPGAQGAWSEAQAAHQPGPHETSGRDSGSVDLNGVRMPGAAPAASHPGPSRRPLHHGPSGPAVPDSSASPVRSLADRGPAGAAPPQHTAPARHAGPPTTGPEYLDIPRDDAALPAPQLGEIPPQGGEPWAPQQAQPQPLTQHEAYPAPAETVVPEGTPVTETSDVTPVPQPIAVAAEEPQVPEQPRSAEAAEHLQAAPAPEAGPAELPAEVREQARQATPGAPLAEATQGEVVSEAVVPDAAVPEAAVPSAAPAAAVPDLTVPAPGAPEPAAFPQAADAADAAVSGDPGAAAEAGPGVEAAPLPQPGAESGYVPTAEQPAFAEAMPAAVAQPPFAMASAQPWADAQVPSDETTQHGFAPGTAQPGFAPETARSGFAPDTAQDAYAMAVGAQPGHASHGGHPAEARHAAPHQPEQHTPQDAGEPQYAPLPGESAGAQAPMPIGQFVPVEGSVPTTPHLAPTPPRPLVVPQDDPAPEAETTADAEQLAAQPAPAAPVAPAAPTESAAPTLVPQGDPTRAAAPEAVPAEAPTATVPAPRDGAEPLAADAAADTALPEAAEPVQDAPVPAASADSPVPPVVAPAEFPAAPETADPAEELDEADDVISFEPIDANEVNEVADAPEMAEAPDAPDTAQGPEALAPQDTPEPVEARTATEAPGLLIIEEDEEAAEPAEIAEPAEPVTSPGTAAPGYDDAEREAVLRVMRERRDIRNGFRGDPIPHEVLLRVLEAAHTAPSVGHSQPWDFVVIKSAETRRTMHELAARQREAYAKSLPKGRAKQFKELKIEAILDTPVNIVVTADPTRGGRHTLGRHTQPQMAPYSSALAVENLWLAARAEGLGVGWVSFFDEREMVRALGLPEHLEVVAYLCVGYVDEFPDEPELMQAGWSKRRPLSWVVHEETYGRRALPGEDPHDLLAETVANIRPLDAKALGEAWERQKRMTKPPGALGMLEIISAQLSGLSRMCPPPIPEPAAVAIFAGDHGVHAQGVTAWPQEVTAQMVANFLGGGAVCNAFANQVGAEVCVIDVGVASELPATPGLLPRKVRAGTADMTTGPALTREEVKAAIEVGVETARDLVAAGNKALLTGEMGIANTTASAALISVYTDVDPAEVTGRGTGINDEMHARKVEVVRRALDLHQPDPSDPIGVLAAVGGLEHAAMVGLLLGGASLRTPVVLDGVSAGAAALVARAIAPEVLAACIAGHRSAEPGHVAALNKLGLRPLVDLDLRLGEGTGALLALPIVQSAARAMHEVATFDSAGVTEK